MASQVFSIHVDHDLLKEIEQGYRKLTLPPARGSYDFTQQDRKLEAIRGLADDWQFWRYDRWTIAVSDDLNLTTPTTVREHYELLKMDERSASKQQADLADQAAVVKAQREKRLREEAILALANPDPEKRDAQSIRQAIQMVSSIERGPAGVLLMPLILGKLSPADLFLSERDQFLTNSTTGLGFLAQTIEKHLQADRLSLVSFGHLGQAILFCPPDEEGFLGRVRREMGRHMWPLENEDRFAFAQRLEDSANHAQRVESPEAFIEAAVALVRERRFEELTNMPLHPLQPEAVADRIPEMGV